MKQLFPSAEWNSTTYLCAADSRQTALADCVQRNGTTKEEFGKLPALRVREIRLTMAVTKRLIEESCGIEPRKGPPLIEGEVLATVILAALFFTIRIVTKAFNLGGGWGADDFTIIISYVREPRLLYSNCGRVLIFCRRWASLFIFFTSPVSQILRHCYILPRLTAK